MPSFMTISLGNNMTEISLDRMPFVTEEDGLSIASVNSFTMQQNNDVVKKDFDNNIM